MAVDKLVDSTQLDADLTSVANAIRTKGGTSAQLAFPDEFVEAIGDISTGITPTGTVNINANGTHDVTNYASAQVAVPNSYAAGDEGKVVNNGALVAQTSATYTENDTYDTTLINEVTVNVSGGGGTDPAHPMGSYHISGTGFDISMDVYRKAAGGTHVKMVFNSAPSSGYLYINLTAGLGATGATYINSRPTWFTIPSGKACALKFSNVVNTGLINFASNFRLANSSTSSSEFGTGNGTHTSGETINATLSSSENIGCMFMAITCSSLPANKTLEFDVSFTVDGVDYF